MIIVGQETCDRTEILVRVSRSPFRVHKLDVQSLAWSNLEGALLILDLRDRRRIEGGDDVGKIPFGFVDYFEHTDGTEGGVCVDFLGQPGEELVCAVVVVWSIEAGIADPLLREYVREL